MAEHLKLINPGAPPLAGGFVVTSIAEEVERSFRRGQAQPGTIVTVIAGGPGFGKTEVLFRLKNSTRGAFIHNAVVSECRPFILLNTLMRCRNLGQANNQRAVEDRERLAADIGLGGTIMIDEAQNLVRRNSKGRDNADTIDWLRQFAEEACIHLVLCGDLRLWDAVQSLPQVRRRAVQPVIIRDVPKADVAAVAASRGATSATIVDILHHVSSANHGLADVVNVLDQAALFAGGEQIELRHVLGAIEALSLKGGN